LPNLIQIARGRFLKRSGQHIPHLFELGARSPAHWALSHVIRNRSCVASREITANVERE
jgi:hypothetical protein